MTPALTLRRALLTHLEASETSVLAFCKAHGFTRSEYTQIVRWTYLRRNPATRRAFRLSAVLRLRLATAAGYQGRVLTDAEIGAQR